MDLQQKREKIKRRKGERKKFKLTWREISIPSRIERR